MRETLWGKQSELSHLGMARHQAFGGCDTSSPGREKRPFLSFRPGNPHVIILGRLFSILDLPLLLPDAIRTGGGMQSTGLATAIHKRHVGTVM